MADETMTVADLLDALQFCDPEAKVRILAVGVGAGNWVDAKNGRASNEVVRLSEQMSGVVLVTRATPHYGSATPKARA
jgi:hypothetical protein